MKKKMKLLIMVAIVSLVIAACGKNDSSSSNENSNNKLQIMTTFYPMYEFTKQVTGDLADVQLLIPANQEPHGWEPTPKNIADVQNADLFIYNSEYMETFVEAIENAIDSEKVVFVEASKNITLKEGIEEGHEHEAEEHGHDEEADHEHEAEEHGHDEEADHEHEAEEHGHEEEADHEHSHEKDPHVWLSPMLAIKEVETITDSIIEADPENREVYEKNSKAYIEKLTALHEEYKEKLSNVKKKEMITQHVAFAYLADEYGLTQVAITGLSPEQEPSAKKLSELKTFANEHQVQVIYFEEAASPKVAETLAKEIKAETEVLSTLETLSKEHEEKGLGYIEVMERNLEKIVAAQSK